MEKHCDGAQRPMILDGVLPQEEAERLAELMVDPRVEDVMIVLAHALRQGVAEGAAPRELICLCDSYVKALVARHKISEHTAESLEQALGAALDAMANELGAEL
ncbi:MAG: hypothetical protein ACUVWR_09940 [Anaerolineae bacterium]